jgi:large subunit ribosomal protein L29|tara:strand:- start:14094 stop:14282 length:189 start_codon:yes stop_codon:yes gene_type:complete
MKKNELSKLTKSEIIKNLDKFKKDLFNLRFQKNNGQLKSPAKFKETRKNIARLKTLMQGKHA